MWLEDTVSPATSTSGTTRVSNSWCERSSSGVPRASLPKRKFSPTETCSAPEPADQHLLARSPRPAAGELAVERDHHQLVHPQPGDQVALDRERVEQLGRGLRVDHRQRVRVEGEHRVAAADDLAVAEVHAVEGADGHAARRRIRRAGGQVREAVTFTRRTLRRAAARRPPRLGDAPAARRRG